MPVGPRRAAEDSFTRLEASPHRKNKRPSNREKHEQGQATVQRSQGGEKADKRRPNNDKAKNR